MAIKLLRGEKVNSFIIQTTAFIYDIDDIFFKKLGEEELIKQGKY